ncbi:MAG: hypothetical protein JWR15_1152 [Prosthecobacter sp.]|nr:hypothetical protein [Prosthecobacter sp.]
MLLKSVTFTTMANLTDMHGSVKAVFRTFGTNRFTTPSALHFRRRSASSFAIPLRHTPALKGLWITAQGPPSLGEATLGIATNNRKANP